MLSVYTCGIWKSLQGCSAKETRRHINWKKKSLKSIQGQTPAWCRSNNHVAVLWINSSWPILSVEGGGRARLRLHPRLFLAGWSGHLFTRVQQQRGSLCPCAHRRTLTGQSMRGRRSRPLLRGPAALKQNEWGSSNSARRAAPSAVTGCISLKEVNKELLTQCVNILKNPLDTVRTHNNKILRDFVQTLA